MSRFQSFSQQTVKRVINGQPVEDLDTQTRITNENGIKYFQQNAIN